MARLPSIDDIRKKLRGAPSRLNIIEQAKAAPGFIRESPRATNILQAARKPFERPIVSAVPERKPIENKRTLFQQFAASPVGQGITNVQESLYPFLPSPKDPGGFKRPFQNIKENAEILSTPEGAQQWLQGFDLGTADKPDYSQIAAGALIDKSVAMGLQVPNALKQTFGKDKTLGDRGVGALTALGGTAATLLPGADDLIFGGYDYLKGTAQAKRQGQSGQESRFAGLKTLAGQQRVGAGDVVTDNPTLATIGNFLELPVLLVAGYKVNKAQATNAIQNQLAKRIQEIEPSLDSKGAKQAAKQFWVDEFENVHDAVTGRFTKKDVTVKAPKSEPVYYGQLRESLGYARDDMGNIRIGQLNPQTGKYEYKTLSEYAKGQGAFARIPGGDPDPGVEKATKGAMAGIKDLQLKKSQEAFKIGKQKSIKPTDAYLQEQIQKTKKIKEGASLSGLQKARSFLDQLKEKFVDSTAPIEDAVSMAEKQGKLKVLPKEDVRLQIDRVLRAPTLADQFVEDAGLKQVIQDAPDLNALDQYMIARHAADVERKGKQTGRNLAQDQQLLQDLAEVYEPYAKQVNQYSQKLLDYSVDRGLISKNLASALKKEYPNYVPLQRVFSELEKATLPKGVGTRSITSLSRQSVVQKLKGSEREIESPIESLLLKTQDAFNQGERNEAARMLAQMRSTPFMKNLIRELGPNEKAQHTFSYLDNGVKRTFETTPEIETAAKNLNAEQMGLIGKIFNVPTRLLQMGATGLNVPFVVTNLLKDQVTGFVNSNRAAKTSLMNPKVFIKALSSAIGHDELYKNLRRSAAGGTSFDIARNQPSLSVEKIRAGKSVTTNAKYLVTHPGQLLRAVEDLVGTTEEVGRIQNFRGMEEALLKEGRTAQDARLLAAQAAQQNTANFLRKGTWGKVLNYVIPYLNAGIQGGRQLTRSFQNNPTGTTAKVVTAVYMPIVASTAWNLSDEKRKAVYSDIAEFERENNIIIVPPNPTKDDKGRWNVIKIPIPPGLSNLAYLVRKPIEQVADIDRVKFTGIATNIITGLSGVDITSGKKLLSSVTPQGLKVPLEMQMNKNLFTGKDIVPFYMQDKPPEEQVYPWTSGTARLIGKATNTSPLKVENATKTAFAGVGSQALNTSDRALSALGVIPSDQIGGESALGNIQRRFSKAYGGELEQQETLSPSQQQSQSLVSQIETPQGSVSAAEETGDITLPTSDKSLEVLYKDVTSTVGKYGEQRAKLDAGLYKTKELEDFREDFVKAANIKKEIENQHPEKVFDFQVEQYKSGGGATVEERADWAYKQMVKTGDPKKAKELYEKMLDGNVMTKSVVEYIEETYGVALPSYISGGKVKSYGGSGGSGRTPKIASTPFRISAPKQQVRTSPIRFSNVKLRPIRPVKIDTPNLSQQISNFRLRETPRINPRSFGNRR